MRLSRSRIFIVPVLALAILWSLTPFQLKKQDVRGSMDEMLAYHVEYKEFTPMLARRALKIYLEQFDPEKVYLLSDEAKPYLDPSERSLKNVVQLYQKDDLSEWMGMNQVVQGAIMRARTMRAQIAKELSSGAEPKLAAAEGHADYATNERDLAARMRNLMTRILMAEMRNAPSKAWTAEQKQKVFALWERRFARAENTYLAVDSKGGKATPQMSDHYLSMHTLKAMAKSLDAHTSYFSPDEAMDMRTSLEKQFEGIGVVLREGVDGVVIQGMVKGGPAERSGKIVAGDLIVDINGESVSNASYEDVLKKLQGDKGGGVQLGLKRFDTSSATTYYKVDLKREKILMEDDRVRYTFEPYANGIIGKLTLPSFYESADGAGCEEDMRVALRELKQKGNLLGLVLDMRDNSGGFLNQAVKVAGLFISSGVIVVSKYSQGEVQYLRDLDGRCYYSGPLVILTSKASASAAEIVAQALQDYGAALVVGDDRTYGKGTIQYQTVTDTRASSFFKVTVGRYYTVSGRSPQMEGVKADIVVPTIYSPYSIGERYLEFPLKNDRIPSVYVDPLVDIDERNQRWFKQNYLPNLQKKLSIWTQMLDQLKENSAYRLKKNRDFALFLKAVDMEKRGQAFSATAEDNYGVDDLQMHESLNIVRDMLMIQASSPKKA